MKKFSFLYSLSLTNRETKQLIGYSLTLLRSLLEYTIEHFNTRRQVLTQFQKLQIV